MATLAVFSSLRVEPALNALVFGEAVCNDAVRPRQCAVELACPVYDPPCLQTSIALYRTFLKFLDTPVTVAAVGDAIGLFLEIMVVSIGIGAVFGEAPVCIMYYKARFTLLVQA